MPRRSLGLAQVINGFVHTIGAIWVAPTEEEVDNSH
jgi:hypothetical protein